MLNITHPNRRITSRYNVDIHGKIILQEDSRNYEEDIHILNISYNGIQVTFSNNDFLLKYFNNMDAKKNNIITKFEFDNETYIFKHSIKWIKIFNIGERNFYTLSALIYENKEEIEKDILNIILTIQMKNIYF